MIFRIEGQGLRIRLARWKFLDATVLQDTTPTKPSKLKSKPKSTVIIITYHVVTASCKAAHTGIDRHHGGLDGLLAADEILFVVPFLLVEHHVQRIAAPDGVTARPPQKQGVNSLSLPSHLHQEGYVRAVTVQIFGVLRVLPPPGIGPTGVGQDLQVFSGVAVLGAGGGLTGVGIGVVFLCQHPVLGVIVAVVCVLFVAPDSLDGGVGVHVGRQSQEDALGIGAEDLLLLCDGKVHQQTDSHQEDCQEGMRSHSTIVCAFGVNI
jgi:hypothetical protein